jgi:RNA polymerase sigma-70 factor (ECF subfamily)
LSFAVSVMGKGGAVSPTVPLDPEQLLCLARAGSSPALGQLLEMYRNYLTLLARLQISRRLQGKADPDDLVQETFLKVARDFALFQGTTEKEWLGWLRQVLAWRVAHLVRHYLGTQGRDARLECELEADLDQSSRLLGAVLAAPGSTPSQRAARREQAVLLADALDRLPEHYREVLILRHLEGLSVAEVAHRMGRSVDSVKNLWTRALARLRRALGEPP